MVTSNPKEHSMDLKVLAHVNGIAEAFQALEDAEVALNKAKQAIREITVEMDIE